MPQERTYYLTKEKKKELEEELDYLKNTKRGEIAKEIERAKSMGDLSENAEYQEARSDQASLEDRIAEIESILKSAQIVEHKQSDTVEVGSTVVLRKKYSSSEITYQIVGSEEADMAQKKISHTSPLGQSLMGRKKDESFTFETPNGEQTYHVVDVK